MPKLSIIIPVHNEEPSLRRCIDSILSQSFKDLEIICVDDGSSDGSAGILQDYINREPRVHATAFQRRLGTVLARKLALLDARGDYIIFADADDWLLPGACETAVRLMKESKADVVQFSVDFEAEQKDADSLDRF
ncbi:MAG: glycosyltransferase family 2 protein, partial [Lentisphaeria bacterium]|nr:glycosyltransferase family 2 protein [Lentisphaeria bacterium]